MHGRGRSGYKLRDLLVVVTLLLVAAGLIVPSVAEIREAARRDLCANKMYNLALATMQYDTANERLPGWANHLCSVALPNNPEAATREVPSTWAFELLPFLGQSQLYDLYGPMSGDAARRCFAGGVPQETLSGFICPTDADRGKSMSYVVNCGLRDRYDWNTTNIQTGKAWGSRHDFKELEPPANGVFHNNYAPGGLEQTKMLRTFNTLGLRYVGDGSACTVLLSENVDAGDWYGQFKNSTPEIYEGAVCFCWTAADPVAAGENPNNGMRINARRGQDTQSRRSPRPSSYHGSGVNVIFCDAHMSFISDQVDWLTWCLLFTPNGRQVMVPGNQRFGQPIPETLLDAFRYTPLNAKF